MRRLLALSLFFLSLATIAGCASIPPGADVPRLESRALMQPAATTQGRTFAAEQLLHGADSGFRIIPVGADGFLLRMQMIAAAEQTLDLQYFVFQGDKTGRLLTEALLHAADRGVRVRLLVDDGQTGDGDEQINLLDAHPSIEIRYFNPFAYRGHIGALRALEFAFHHARLDYRMHNKLLVADNAMALIGGRNIGDAYFQIDRDGQFADDDMFATGPVVTRLSAVFDEFWNNPLAIPVAALTGAPPTSAQYLAYRRSLEQDAADLEALGPAFASKAAIGQPYAGLTGGQLPLVWAHVLVIADSPDKKDVDAGEMIGRLMRVKVAEAMRDVHDELLLITPYFIPGSKGMALLNELRLRNVRLRILTNSLESSTEPLAQAAYMRYRAPLIASGAELFEIRALLGNTRGSGQTAEISQAGNYSLHAKLFVFDRKRLFIGSMNLDRRSLHLNTEIGLLIDSPELAQQLAARFEAMTRPANAYQVLARPDGAGLAWRTEEDQKKIDYLEEPARSCWQRLEADLLAWLPFDSEL